MAVNLSGTPRVVRSEIDMTTQPATEGVTIGGAVIEATNGPVNQRIYVNSRQQFSSKFGTPVKDPNAKTAKEIQQLNLKNSGLYGGNILLNEFEAMYFVRASDDRHYYANISIRNTSADLNETSASKDYGRYAKSYNIPTIKSSLALTDKWYDGYTSLTGTGDPGIRDYEESPELVNRTGTNSIVFGAISPGDDGNRLAISIIKAPTSAQLVSSAYQRIVDGVPENYSLIDETGRLSYRTQLGTTGLDSIVPFVTGPNGFNWLWSYDDVPLEFINGEWTNPAGNIWQDLYKVNVYRAPLNASRNFFDPRMEDLILVSGKITPGTSAFTNNLVNGEFAIDFQDDGQITVDTNFTIQWNQNSDMISTPLGIANAETLSIDLSTLLINGNPQSISGNLADTQRIVFQASTTQLPWMSATGPLRTVTSGVYADIDINGGITVIYDYYLTDPTGSFITARNSQIRFVSNSRWNDETNGQNAKYILRQSYWDRFNPIESFTVSNYQISDLSGSSLFITDLINGFSDNIYVPTNTVEGSTIFNSQQIEMFNRGENSGKETQVDYQDKMAALQLFEDREKVSVDVLINTDLFIDQLSSPSAARFIAYQRDIARVAALRMDAIASIQVTGIGDDTPERVLRSGLVTNNLRSPSYAALYAGYDKFFDSTNGVRILIPKSVAGAYIMARTDHVARPWNAPAGTDRGIVDYSLGSFPNINAKEYGILYDNNINSTLVKTGFGNVMWGQKTAQTKKTALDRINVRRMLLYVENHIEKILEPFILNTENTPSTRAIITRLCNNFLETVLVGGGISFYNVVCDDSNNDNTSNTITVSVQVMPVRVVEYINFITIAIDITSEGLSVTES